LQLYNEKALDMSSGFCNDAMRRGIAMEPGARLQYTFDTGTHVEPAVLIKEWQMASVDGLSEDGTILVEIKCPGISVHEMARLGKVPEYYYPQLQHQLCVCDLDKMHYYSFDGSAGILLEVFRDDAFIKNMVDCEREFYQRLIDKIPPEPEENDCVSMDGNIDWLECSQRFLRCKKAIEELEKEQEFLKNQLIFISRGNTCKGNGISLSKMTVKGSVDYSSIPELSAVNLDKYRKPESVRWRISG